MATKQQKEELIKVLKFTPIKVRLLIQGYGGESYAGVVDRKIYNYFAKHKIDLEEYVNDWDGVFDKVPAELRPFDPGSAYECDNLWHASGAELSDLNEIRVEAEDTSDVIWEHSLDYTSLEDAGVSVGELGGCELDDLDDGTVVFNGAQGEKGCFFDAEFTLREPFDPKKLNIGYENCDGWYIVTSVEYDGEELDGTGGYSTTGKWAENKWIIIGDEEVYEPVSFEEQEGTDYLQEAVDALNETFADELATTDKDPLEIMYGYTEWYPADIKPVRKGFYECEFESTTWPFPIERMCEWTGRIWKDDGKKAVGIKQWRGLASKPHEGE